LLAQHGNFVVVLPDGSRWLDLQKTHPFHSDILAILYFFFAMLSR